MGQVMQTRVRKARRGEGDCLRERPAMYVVPKLCRRCTDCCCEAFPGLPFPEDFGSTSEEVCAGVDRALLTGFWQVDYWEGANDYFIRPALVGDPVRIEHPAWPGRCTFLNKKEGCRLPATRRPYQCRHLEPKAGPRCVVHGGDKRAGVKAWKEHSSWLEQAEERLSQVWERMRKGK